MKDGLELILAGSCIIGLLFGLAVMIYGEWDKKIALTNLIEGFVMGVVLSWAVVAVVIACALLGGGVLTVIRL